MAVFNIFFFFSARAKGKDDQDAQRTRKLNIQRTLAAKTGGGPMDNLSDDEDGDNVE